MAGFFESIRNIFATGGKRRTVTHKRYDGASTGNLYYSWTTSNYSADSELYASLRSLRARSRELERNNDYAKKFVRMVKTNIVGNSGIMLQVKAITPKGKDDRLANIKIEEAFREWSKRGNCDVTGRYSFRDIQKLVIGSVARDGEVLLRKIITSESPWGFQLQLIEADHLDEMHNDTLANGNIIKMGIELNQFGKPVAYHLHTKHPGDVYHATRQSSDKIRVNASEILHVFLPHRISQARGVPWMHAAMARLNMLGKYEEAEVVAARLGASKGGFYQRELDATQKEYIGDTIDSDGNPIQSAEPGIFEVLPEGWKFTPYDPQHPTSAFADFSKSILRGIASGLDVSYNYLANDLENVNYSSIRAGVLDERDVWRDLQAFMADHFLTPVFSDWLRYSMLTGAVNLPMRLISNFNRPKWMPRGWAWVDPEKDMKAALLAVENNLRTRTEIAAEQGKDFEDILNQLAAETELMQMILKQTQPQPAASDGGQSQ